MVHLYLFMNSFKKAVNLNLSRFFQPLVSAVLVGEPNLPGPKSIGPVPVFHRPVKIVFAVRIFKYIRKLRKHMKNLSATEIQRRLDLIRTDLRVSFQCNRHTYPHFCAAPYLSLVCSGSADANFTLLFYPLSSVEATPSTKYFCIIIKINFVCRT